MEDARQAEGERRELRGLIERIKRGDCVLVLGPRVSIRADDPDRRPLDELLAAELHATVDPDPPDAGTAPVSLRRAAEQYYRARQDREDLELAVQEFYQRESVSTTDFHRDLAHLPFRLIVNASPDDLMLNALVAAQRQPQVAGYSFKHASNVRAKVPSAQEPLLYHLFGHHRDPGSLVLTEGDLIEFLVAIVRGSPAVPDQVRSIVADPAASFVFLGFGFENWYLRVLLQVMNVYGHRSKAIAFEDVRFFSHPDRAQAVGFFSGNRLIEFRPLEWEVFAHRLRVEYEANVVRMPLPAPTPARAPDAAAPLAFLSYASDDREQVEQLAARLQAQGVRVWQDAQNLRAGDNWDRVLHNVISRRVDYVVVVQTPAMTSRIEGVFHREIDAALARQLDMGEFDGETLRFLIPVRIGACELLSRLDDQHVVDVGDDAGVAALALSVLEDWQRRAAKRAGLPAAA